MIIFISECWFKNPTCFAFIFYAYSRNFRKIWILLIRPQADRVKIALSGGIPSETLIYLFNSGSDFFIIKESLY